MGERRVRKVYRPASGVAILGTGAYLPGSPVPNEELLGDLRLPAGWIERRTGIASRHRAPADLMTSDLAAEAARRALADARCEAGDLDRILVATISGDWPTPATACAVQRKIGAECPAEDKNAACAGFLYALDQGVRLVATGESRVLAIGAEIRSRWVDPTDRRTAPLFGDGAGAAVLGPCEARSGFLALALYADGAGAENVYVPAGGSARPTSTQTLADGLHTIRMTDGAAVFADGVAGMAGLLAACLEGAGVALSDVDLLVPHQNNLQMLSETCQRLAFPMEKVVVNLDRVANTVAASVPLALDEARRSGRCPPGSLVALVAVGGGYTGGAALYRVP